MQINKLYIIAGLIIAFGLFYVLTARADESDRATTFTFNQPVQIPGQVLPAGTYVFKLANPDSVPNVVQIFNSDQTHLYATLETIPTDRQNPAGHTVITLAEQGAGKPDVLLKWFYPGNLTGNEFLYSDHREKELAHAEQRTIVADQQPTYNSEMSGVGK
jgi:Protein of unknown function (DUF2911)